ncbi:MAG: fumarylacetoacetate hydrolase family protein [Thauera sp.]|jgi:fumarylpyruvate hydrolase|nr:fumarylacetoacetate hydrolase family protein [Thauera sp.]
MNATQLPWPFPTQSTLDVHGSAQRLPVGRIFCVGRNYQGHAIEMGTLVDKSTMQPFYFLKDSASLLSVPAGNTGALPYPPATADFHHEAELVVVIGKAGFQLKVEQAASLIHGYAVGLDMTRRDLQQTAKDSKRPWDVAKNFEHGAVCSAVVLNPALLSTGEISLRVNGELRQQGNLNQMIWNISELIADLSRYYHLQPGDLLFTGTPEGVGPVVGGDRIEVSIAGVGELKVKVV